MEAVTLLCHSAGLCSAELCSTVADRARRCGAVPTADVVVPQSAAALGHLQSEARFPPRLERVQRRRCWLRSVILREAVPAPSQPLLLRDAALLAILLGHGLAAKQGLLHR